MRKRMYSIGAGNGYLGHTFCLGHTFIPSIIQQMVFFEHFQGIPWW